MEDGSIFNFVRASSSKETTKSESINTKHIKIENFKKVRLTLCVKSTSLKNETMDFCLEICNVLIRYVDCCKEKTSRRNVGSTVKFGHKEKSKHKKV